MYSAASDTATGVWYFRASESNRAICQSQTLTAFPVQTDQHPKIVRATSLRVDVLTTLVWCGPSAALGPGHDS